VGFRPFIYRLACSQGLVGWVRNTSDGVEVHIEGVDEATAAFLCELPSKAPSASHISEITTRESTPQHCEGFVILPSLRHESVVTSISPDIATCPQCLAELFDPDDRRFHYPFINCTDCGPRFTIIKALPYDRPDTSMCDFEMCADCAAEYSDPNDRRFHAQPDACFDCGPHLTLWKRNSAVEAHGLEGSDAVIETTCELLRSGQIVAIKGLGGYHLACDAGNEVAVNLLRARKRRTDKPFAVMVRDIACARALCRVGELEADLLTGTVRPIVLLERHTPGEAESAIAPATASGAVAAASGSAPATASGSAPAAASGASATATSAAFRATLAPSVAGSLHEIGVMLPATPVQHLLMAQLDIPLVMTSGNLSEEPIIADVEGAHVELGSIADAFLDNDRKIISRYDDSVVRVIDEQVYLVRRARGYAPAPLPFVVDGGTADASGGAGHSDEGGEGSEGHSDEGGTRRSENAKSIREISPPVILAVGPEQKSTITLTRGDEAFVSQHLGDLASASALRTWRSTVALYERLFNLRPEVIACDLHPEYLATKWARSQEQPRVEIQHHHAHIASVLAEAQVARAIGIAFDGTGLGDDGSIWGGEVLIATLEDYERFAHLRPVPLPGGAAAIEHPERMAFSLLRSLDMERHPGASWLLERLGADRRVLLEGVISAGLNSPLTSSMGRLFDAVSALCGICANPSYEGQAAVELEALLYGATQPKEEEAHIPRSPYRFALDLPIIDPTPVLAPLLDDLAAGLALATISLRFHRAVVRLILEIAEAARNATGLNDVALAGGVFMNRYLLTWAPPALRKAGFTVLTNRELPTNDGAISYGQAAVAAAQLARLAADGIELT
jgi:hydrogenase maturation protein HypF